MNDTRNNYERNAALEALECLPFVGHVDDMLHFWKIEPTGHGLTDFNTGEFYARLAIEFARRVQDSVVIASVLIDMMNGGLVGQMEAGFLFGIARAARAGAMN